jgi:arylsulfatase A-like enzyme
LLDSLHLLGLDKNTLVIFTSDNGPAPHFNHERTAGLRGAKVSLYEGGMRMPFIAWGAGVPAGKTDSGSVVTATDLMPSFAALAGIKKIAPGDGEDKSAVFYGKAATRKKDIYWEYGRNDISFGYPRNADRSPSLAMRSGRWKLLMNPDGSRVELYDLLTDKNETTNLAATSPETVASMKIKLLNWWQKVPH